MNDTWFFALGFSNLCHAQLQPAPDVETDKQRRRRKKNEFYEDEAIKEHCADLSAANPP